MGLMQLLTVGRSLSEAREQRHRYKLKNKVLPMFGNPAAPTSRSFEVAVKPGGKVGPERAATKYMKTETVADAAAPATSANPFPNGRWTLKANLFKSAKEPLMPVVQGELSLDKVKPMRNDLSDSDLELVAAAKRPEAATTMKIESEEVPVAKAQPMLGRVLALFQRRN
ncbi:MAG TPA: hypothetical protein VNT99_13920 [Methylomirabilota bacterium]|nr:hypothetical protein [Methylomirabilota bacterium]